MRWPYVEGTCNLQDDACDGSHGYMRALNRQSGDRLLPAADDVASPGLDLRVREPGVRRGGIPSFLAGR